MEREDFPSLDVGTRSDVGAVRGRNEDAYMARPDLGLWVVADGMGGAAAGEVASGLTTAEVEKRVAAGNDLVDAIQAAHEAILSAAAEGQGRAGMGSTVVCLRLYRDAYEIAWVGDSRAYLLRQGVLRPLTRDHSLIQYLIERGELTAAEARRHPYRSVITQAVGGVGTARPIPDHVTGKVQPGDRFLLCTDGLTDELDTDQLLTLLRDAADAQKASDALVEAAVAAGGNDNVTAMVVALGRPR